MEEEIIQPIDRELLKSELTPDKQLRMTNKSHNEIYIVTAKDSPNVLKEIGRLREIAFREAGGGTGKSMDLDEFDFGDNCYKQLIVWNPEADEIIGGYRYLLGKDWQLDEKGQPKLATSHMFHFSDKFLKEYMPYTVELGRSFVSLEYQNVRTNTKSIFALDNLWDGLGALTVLYPEIKYFFGKMTMYPSYIRRGRDMILYFLKKHFDDKENLVIPMKPLKLDTPESDLAAIFTEDDFKADYRILNREVRKLGYNIPPLVNAYMSLSPTMKLFGTAINYGFGDVEETGILIAIDEILEEKRVRHINSFIKEHPDFSYHGRKGILAMTGYNGVLGYRTDGAYKTKKNLQDDQKAFLKANPDFDYDKEVKAAKKVAKAMKKDGWEFASHTWGHRNATSSTAAELKTDNKKWEKYVAPILGKTDMIIFAFGADIGDWEGYTSDNAKYEYYKSRGYRYFCNVDSSQYFVQITDDYFRQGRRNLDGYRMYYNPEMLSDLFDVSEVWDSSRPTPVPGM